MKTLILYATKYGAAREIANRIAKRMGDATVLELGKDQIPALDGFDRVVIGSSVYAGQLRKEAKEFVQGNAEALCKAPLGLFVSGLAPDGEERYLTENYPAEVVAHAKAKAMLGGIHDPKKESLFERLVMRIIVKSSTYTSTVTDDKIAAFVEAIQQ